MRLADLQTFDLNCIYQQHVLLPEMAAILVVTTDIPSTFADHAEHHFHFFVHYDVSSAMEQPNVASQDSSAIDTLQLHCGRRTVDTAVLYGTDYRPTFAADTSIFSY